LGTDEPVDFIFCAARCKPVGNVLADWRLDDSDLAAVSQEASRDCGGVFLTFVMRTALPVCGRIVIGDDYDGPSTHWFGVLLPPLARSHRIASCQQTKALNGVNVLFAFADENRIARTFEQFGESI